MIIAHAEFDMDSNCVWARTSEGNIVIVDCDAFEKAYADGIRIVSDVYPYGKKYVIGEETPWKKSQWKTSKKCWPGTKP